jgi:hypothetical protein
VSYLMVHQADLSSTQMGLLHPIGADLLKLRNRLYADDAALFVGRPYDSDIRHMQQLLHSFGIRHRIVHNIRSQCFLSVVKVVLMFRLF